MRRRDFMVLGGAAVMLPLAARAQQPALPVIGFVTSRSADASADLLRAFLKGLSETGYVEGQNVTVEDRSLCEIPAIRLSRKDWHFGTNRASLLRQR